MQGESAFDAARLKVGSRLDTELLFDSCTEQHVWLFCYVFTMRGCNITSL